MTLFKTGNYKLHSGEESDWIIDCNALNEDDWNTLARRARIIVSTGFGTVVGVPRGGLKFAEALKQYIDVESSVILIADDVFTTGGSMWEMHRQIKAESPDALIVGIVAFARKTIIDSWIKAVWLSGETNG